MTGGIGLIILILAYFLPAFVAYNRKHNNSGAIFLLNLLLGWTLIGWVVALIWAISNPSVVAHVPYQAVVNEGNISVAATLPKFTSSAIANPGDIVDRLHKLESLKQSGSLTEQEYNKLKTELINS